MWSYSRSCTYPTIASWSSFPRQSQSPTLCDRQMVDGRQKAGGVAGLPELALSDESVFFSLEHAGAGFQYLYGAVIEGEDIDSRS